MQRPTLVLSAFGIHTGGALVLLDALVTAAADRIGTVFLDARIGARFARAIPQARIVLVPPGAASRVATLMRLVHAAGPTDRLLCFNNLPPLGRSHAYTVTYVHTAYLTGFRPTFPQSPRERARQAFERAMFRIGRANSDAFWVQTPTAARGLARKGVEAPILVRPFSATSGTIVTATPASRPRTFIYPASGVPHKNHTRLFQAWALLGESHPKPILKVTLARDAFAARSREAGLAKSPLANVMNLGEVSHEDSLSHIASSDALIFPSLAETLGLPLIEATAAGTPILAAEQDYVRDVCVPTETFDPMSPRSIADAVLRFIGTPRPPVAPLSPAAFVDTLFA